MKQENAVDSPLSPPQRRLWFLSRLYPDSGVFNITGVLRMVGAFDAGAFVRAVSRVVARHDLLRTTFSVDVASEPRQLVTSSVVTDSTITDLRAEPSPLAAARQQWLTEASRAFDITRAPLHRLRIWQIGDAEHLVSFTIHHLVSDGISMRVCLRDVADFYATEASGAPSALSALPVSYFDWIDSEHARLASFDRDAEVAYWARHMADVPPLDLAADRTRPVRPSHDAALAHFVLPGFLITALQELAAQRGATLFTALTAAYQYILSRYSGQDDFAIGTVVHGRRTPKIYDVVGFFVGTVPLRADVSGNPSFVELIRRVRAELRAAFRHQSLSFDQIVEAARIQRDPSRHPLLQAIIVTLPQMDTAMSLPDTRVEMLDWRLPMLEGDLLLELRPESQQTRGTLFGAADLFDTGSVELMAGAFVTLLERAAAEPTRALGELSLLTPEQKRKVLGDWAEGTKLEQELPSIPEFVERQAQETPDRIAIGHGGVEWTYRAINGEANRLAHQLRDRGMDRGQTAAVLFSPCPEMIVAALAVMKCGAAYVPIDPEFPAARVEHILTEANVSIVLCHPGPAHPGTSARAQLPLQLDPSRAGRDDPGPVPVRVLPSDSAFVLFTSGSTGKPKGVDLPHRTLTRLFREPSLIFRPDDVAIVGYFGFDIHTHQTWAALSVGARLVLLDHFTLSSGHELAKVLIDQRVTVFHVAATQFNLVARANPAALARVRLALLSGEPADPPSIRRVLAAGFSGTVSNEYGPTEAGVLATIYPIRELAPEATSVPIGRPIIATTVMILGADLQPVPVGAVGDIYIGGMALAHGYRGRPDLTAERFLDDPFRGPPSRLYRTGDRGRYRADGLIEFHGRSDTQIKLRGLRIELSEVESVLGSCPGVHSVAVLVREDEPGNPCLVAYVAGRSSLQEEALRTHARQQLPEYMVPSAWVLLPQLPRTVSGKLDRNALPPPARHTPAPAVTPRTETEATLERVWCQVLRHEHVDVHSNFFDLGGHSLLATQLVSRIRTAFGVELAVRTVFEAPTVALLADRIDRAETARTAAIERVGRVGPLPLSFAQEPLWFLGQLDPSSTAYHMAGAVWLDGLLDLPALRSSLAQLGQRHEALRTTFVAVDGQPEQRVGSVLPTLEQAEVQGDAAAAEALLAQWAQQPFDLSSGPLARMKLWRLSAQQHLLGLMAHHIVVDGWSMGLLLRELSRGYNAHRQGTAPALDAPPIQMVDHAAWQRHWYASAASSASLHYWHRQLADLPVLELPADLPRPAVRSDRGGQVNFTLDPELSRALEALAQARGVTPFMLLLAAFQCLLQRTSGQCDFAVGTPMASRTRAELEPMVGMLVNPVVLRADLSGDPSFDQLLARVRDTVLAAYDHQLVPFDKLVETLRPQRDLSRNPLFQVMLSLQEGAAQIVMSDLQVTLVELLRERARFDLTVDLARVADGYQGCFEFSTDLFTTDRVARMIGHFETLLRSIVANPSERVSALRILPEHERRTLLTDWAEGTKLEQELPSIPEFVERQAQETPDRIAIGHGGVEWTYRAINGEANRLAHQLRDRGMDRGQTAAVLFSPCPEMIVAALAVMKCGAAYVPIDPEFPAARVEHILTEANVSIVLCHPGPAHPGTSARAQLPLQLDPSRAGRDDPGPVPVRVLPSDSAFVLFTSGSTGKPKGVDLPHRTLTRLFREPSLIFRPDDVAIVGYFGFDIHTHQTWAALSVGARLVLLDHFTLSSGHELAKVLIDQRVTVFHVAATQFNLVARANPAAFARVRLAVLSGEPVDPLSIRRVFTAGFSGTAINGYGPTEAGVLATIYPIRELAPEATSVPIGRPIIATTVMILGADLQPVPVGAVGDIYIGGMALAHGYRGRPDLTAERFLDDPFRGPPSRLYRTGDRGRYRADGLIEFHGRSDTQIKLRGLRIELSEVESVLGSCPGVHSVAVLVREDEPGNPCLVAYVAGRSSLQEEALRTHARQQLPEYMVPSAWVLLPQLPRTVSGKLDRNALPPPARHTPAPAVTPRTETEATLERVWCQVLRHEHVDVHSNFFDLGGHSLLATQLVSRIRTAFGVELAVRTVFEAPTVALLADRIDRAETARTAAIERVGRVGPLPLSFAQEPLWFLGQLDPSSTAYHMAGAVWLDGSLDLPALRSSLAQLGQRHEALRTTFVAVDGQPEQRVGSVLPTLEQAEVQGDAAAAEALLAQWAQQPFDLSSGPLARMKLWRLSAQQHLLGLMAHHIVVDGWSMGLLLRELSRGYNAHRQGTAPALDPPPIQMVDHAAWQRRWYASAASSASLHYWHRQLADLPVLELPADLPRPAVRSDRGGQVNFTLDPELSRALEALAQARGVTPFMLLLAAFQCLLQRTSGQCDFAVGTPMANRTRAELEPMVGMLVNPVVLRADLSGDPSFDQLLARVRDTVLAAYDHQLVPFDKLVETLRPQRDLSRNPLFQVMLSLQNIQQAELQLEGIDTRAVLLPAQRAKFDLTLELSRTARGYAAWLEYSGDLFETESARALANRFQALLAALVEHPERAVSRSSALPPEEQAAVLRAAGEGRGPLTHHQTLAGWFEAQAGQTPDATAVSWLDRRWTYRELDRLANRIAHRLIAEGVLPGQRVGLLMSRSLQAVAAILGVWKAGAAYVPLSPEEPPARRHRLIAEAAIRCVLCAQMPEDAGSVAHMLVEDAFAGAPDTRPAVRCDGDALAYVMFTSGSTGVPKGVEVPHRALVVRMEWEAFPWGADEVTCQKTGLGFVDSVWELFAPLVRGHRVVIADDGTVRDPQQLTALLARERVTRLVLVPSLLSALLEGVPDLATRLPNLASWSCTGEPLTAQLRTLFYEKLPGRRLLNLYGTTETWDALAEDVTVLPDPARITVGRALPYVRAYVLDGDTLAAPGVPGELCIGGHGLALRYHSGETSSPPRFGPDPFIPGGRLYRTGDRARVGRDGRIELLGRQDFQLKLRGVRIDPAEIEHALRRCGVREALVVVRGEGPAAQLVAYLAADGDLAPDPGVLRATLREQLPASLVPSAFVPLPTLPRNAAGKIDRAKLPDPSGSAGGSRAPRDPWELRVQQVWEQVLGEREIAVDASFFDVGGNSLLAAVCWRRICDLGGLGRPLAWFFQRPTIAELAALLRDGGWRSPRSVVVPFRTTGTQPPLYLAHPAGGHVLGYLPLSRALGAQQPVFGLQSPRLYEPGDGHESVEAQAAHFARVLAEHHRGGPVVLGGWSFGGLLAIEMASLLGPLGVEVAAVILFDTWVPEGHSEREELSDVAIVREYLEENGSQLGGELPEQGIAALVSQLHHAGALPNSLGEQELRRMLAIYRSNRRAATAYRPVPVRVPVLQFVARERAGAPCQEPWRWQPLAARLDTVEAEGNHHTLLSAAHVAAVAREITARSRTGFVASAREGGAGGC